MQKLAHKMLNQKMIMEMTHNVLILLLLITEVKCNELAVSAKRGSFSSVICTCEESAYQIQTKTDLDTLTTWTLKQKHHDNFPIYLGILKINPIL